MTEDVLALAHQKIRKMIRINFGDVKKKINLKELSLLFHLKKFLKVMTILKKHLDKINILC